VPEATRLLMGFTYKPLPLTGEMGLCFFFSCEFIEPCLW